MVCQEHEKSERDGEDCACGERYECFAEGDVHYNLICQWKEHNFVVFVGEYISKLKMMCVV